MGRTGEAAAAMAEILFIKTSSLGDVVHHMPAVTDARRHLPDARLAWVVEEDYAPLARLHPAVDDVIPVATRRWRKRPFARNTWREIGRFRDDLRARSFAATIDAQGLLRSALITRAVRGSRHGYDRASIREPLACPFYDVRHRVEFQAHAILRNRTLCGLALGYEAKHPLDYGLDRAAIAGAAAARPYGLLIHGTAQARKLWSEPHWVTMAKNMRDRGFDVVLPWGSAPEFARSQSIAAAAALGSSGRVPDRLPLDEVAKMIAGASFAIGVDTGLVHIAAALGVPLVAIFVGSEPGLTGPMGGGPIHVVGGRHALPDPAQVLQALDRMIRPAA
jgi:heptosyltransferase I